MDDNVRLIATHGGRFHVFYRGETPICRCMRKSYKGDYCMTCGFWYCENCGPTYHKHSVEFKGECLECQVGD